MVISATNHGDIELSAEEITEREAELAVWQAGESDRLKIKVRAERDSRLAQTDFYALNDVTMSDAMKTYRQALRDLPAHEDWPNVEFPERPSE
jgi:hypothetical protein